VDCGILKTSEVNNITDQGNTMKLIYRGTTYDYNPKAQESYKEQEIKEA
jgi:Domain of unknown function (DUF4278)